MSILKLQVTFFHFSIFPTSVHKEGQIEKEEDALLKAKYECIDDDDDGGDDDDDGGGDDGDGGGDDDGGDDIYFNDLNSFTLTFLLATRKVNFSSQSSRV